MLRSFYIYTIFKGFKFNQNAGRQELIKGIAGGDANKKKYFSGCCQFIKEAKKVILSLNLVTFYCYRNVACAV